MNITNVKISKFDSQTNVKAMANITFDNEFVVSGLRVIDGTNGLFVAMPSRKGQDGEYHDIAFPITKEAREDIQYAVLTKYHESHVEPPQTVVDVMREQGTNSKHAKIDVDEKDLPF